MSTSVAVSLHIFCHTVESPHKSAHRVLVCALLVVLGQFVLVYLWFRLGMLHLLKNRHANKKGNNPRKCMNIIVSLYSHLICIRVLSLMYIIFVCQYPEDIGLESTPE